MVPKYIIYTDGAYSSARNVGGIGMVFISEGKKVLKFSKAYKNTTSQRMELMAAIVALESLEHASEVTIISDSQYLVKTMTDNWKRKKNLDLWERLDKLVLKHSITFKWVKGHFEDKYNSEADKLAFDASQI